MSCQANSVKMSVIFQTLINSGKRNAFNKSILASISSCKCLSVRKFSDIPKKFASFDGLVAQRRAEARRSLVVQVNSESSFNELYAYCSKYAEISGIHHYRNSGGEHFMLIEFPSEDNLKNILQNCSSHQKDIEVLPSQSPFLWFRAAPGKKEKLTAPPLVSLTVKDGNAEVNEDVLFEELLKCSTVSDQIQLLYDRTKLNDLGVRLRYMVARQLEVIFEGLYANIAVRPFGSSVNGFGRMGCDLDLVLTNVVTKEMSDPSKRLVFQQKACAGGRGAGQRQLELAAELLELRAAGAARVTRILHARVPIVKYAHDLTDLACDLCCSNMSGVHMSELLWLCGALDARVRPLAGAVRRWARAAGLTSPHPGRWITNFPLTLMVLFFLQQDTSAGAVLPPVRSLVKWAGKDDIRLAEENVNCTFLRDLNKLPPECYGQNSANLEVLLLQFFEFYAQFDFQDKAISINDGVPIRKPNSLPLYIVNPLETSLNVSRNVSYEECQRLQAEVRNAAWQLEAGLEGPKSDDWGILGLIEKKASRGLKKLLRVGNSHRLVSVKDLFNDEDKATDELKNKSQRLSKKTDREIEDSVKDMKKDMEHKSGKVKTEPLKFKNRQLVNEVLRIRRNKLL